MKPLKKLFTPFRIGSMEIKNRMAMAPMATDFANPDGTISQRMIDYFEARARGGVGLIIMEVVTVDELSPYVPKTVAIWDDKFIPSLKTLTDAIHAHGAKVIPLISHPGPESLAPSVQRDATRGTVSDPLSRDQAEVPRTHDRRDRKDRRTIRRCGQASP